MLGILRSLSRHACIGVQSYTSAIPRGDVKRSKTAVLADSEPSCVEQLARFFPQATRVRIPVQVTALRAGSTQLREAAVLEFATPKHGILVSTLPLEFDDRLRLEPDRGGSPTEATVVAVQYQEGHKAVAVRFANGRCDWIGRP
jgi:hypothetical protein